MNLTAKPYRPGARSMPAVVTLLIVAFSVVSGDCLAQGLFNSNSVSGMAEFLPPPRSVRQQIREAEDAIEEERYSDAVVRLGDLLRRLSQDNLPETAQDYFLDSASPSAARDQLDSASDGVDDFGRPMTVMRQAREMIGQLPKPAMEIYELRYGPLAAKILDDAQPDRDWEAVEQVRREFFHTEAGYHASSLLATREWLLGNALAVSLLLDDVVRSPRAIEQLGDEVIWLHAGACLLSSRSLPTPGQLPADFVAAENRDPQALPAVKNDWESAVRARFSAMAFTVDPPAEDYPFLGGRPNRSGFSEGEMPLSNPRWMLETSGSPLQERMIEAETAQLKSSGQLPPPSWLPLRVGDQLLMRTTQRLIGADYRTGKRVWQYPWFDTPEELTTPDEADANDLREKEDPKDILVQRIWNDVPYGQVSSDGRQVYMINDLGAIESERFNPFGMRATRAVQASKNTLVALDLATEGKLLWRLGSSETTPSSLSEAFFLGPPLPVRGRLYVMAELAGEIILVCLDPQDGSELWRQVLVSVEASGITTDPVRRVAGAMPTYHEGLLVCPTGAGVTVAVNLVDRTLRWANEHPRNREFSQNAFRQPVDLPMNQLSQRWLTSVAIGHETSIALTPVESDRMIVVDAVTGVDRFRPQPRGKNLYLAGIRNNQYLIVRGDRVMAFDLQTGNEIWSTPSDLMSPGQRVSGRGVFGPASYFLPTTSDELIEIGLASGEILSRRHTRYPLGNLVAAEGEIISQASATVAVAYGEETLRPTIDRILADDPDDFFAIIRKAELLMEDDRRDDALALLKKAREMDPESIDAIALSVEALLGSLRDQEKISPEDMQTLRELIDRPEQQAELLVLQIQGLLEPLRSDPPATEISQSDVNAAMDRLLELSALTIERPSLANQQAAVFADSARQFTLASWLTARVAQVANAADEDTLAEINERLQEHLQTGVRANRTTLNQIVSHFSPLGDAVQAYRQSLVQQSQQQGDALATERLVWGTRLPTDAALHDLDSQDLLTLARTYSEAQWGEDRRYVGQVLQQRIQDPKASPAEIQRIAGILDEYQVRGNIRPRSDSWPREHVELQWESTRLPQNQALMSNRRYAKTTRWMGKQTLGWQAISDNTPLSLLDQDGINHPIMVDGLTNRTSSDKEVTLSGGLMLVLTPSELIAVDLFRVLSRGSTDAVRWRQSLHPDGQSVAKRRSETSKFGDKIYRYVSNSPTANADDAQLRLGPVLGDRLFLLQGRDLICYHTVTGEQLWRTQTSIPGSGVVAGDGRVAVLSERADQIAYFDWHDGREMESKPFNVDSVMATAGRHVLLVTQYDEEDADSDLVDPYMLEIVDGITQDRVQERVASPINLTDQARSTSQGRLVNDRYMTLIDSDGRATIWDVLSGASLADVEIPLRPRLSGLSVVQIHDRFLLMPRCELPPPPDIEGNVITIPSGMSVQDVTSAHCIELADDETDAPAALAWSQTFEQARGVTTFQPWMTPILTLVRRQTYIDNASTRRHELDVWALDVESGKTLNELLGKNIGSRNIRIETEVRLLPSRDQVFSIIQSQLLTYTFSNQKPTDTEANPESSDSTTPNAAQEPDESQ
ncbi:outer membrane protein assembly factor BamB family protein [Allorhodopirellula solitaria]|uniref:PQQ enzyme repeat protein n=1 Tax=Allorhodopirellula solitaria TaxID=2527987 RepID=A0A5C5XTD5_9BACT|nr:PQQ-binding-like beta-propeller repeat protein [Allorhodopirellula solitaria]TWT65275.1 PQQ enzyme repeat protein [Allorhodopirellula solitaria]